MKALDEKLIQYRTETKDEIQAIRQEHKVEVDKVREIVVAKRGHDVQPKIGGKMRETLYENYPELPARCAICQTRGLGFLIGIGARCAIV